MTEAKDALQRFRASMALDYEKWRDGVPYDIAALDEMTSADRARIGAEISGRSTLDWRDVEALRRIGTPEALARIDVAASAQSDHGGAAALRAQAETGWTAALEARFLATLETARLMETSFDRLFEIAARHPTSGITAKLVQLATEGEQSVRYAFGAFLLYLHGHTDEWYGLNAEFRPQLLALSGDGAAQSQAQDWLRRMIAAPLRNGAGPR